MTDYEIDARSAQIELTNLLTAELRKPILKAIALLDESPRSSNPVQLPSL